MYKELATKYGLTEKQVQELDEQYWMEYVAGNVYRMEHDSIILEYLGSFRINKNACIRTKKALEYKMEVVTSERYRFTLQHLINKIEGLITLKANETIKSDSKRYKKS